MRSQPLPGFALFLSLALAAFSQESPLAQDDRFRIALPEPPQSKVVETAAVSLPKVSSSIAVIKGPDANSLGARFMTDELRRIPGLEVQRLSSTESAVSARGYNDDSSASQGILCLVDGRPVNQDFFGAVLWDAIPLLLHEVDQIEVLRGPGSFVHGDSAMHGLVSFRTKSPLEYFKGAETADEHLLLQSGYGSYRSTLGGLTYVRRQGGAAIKASVARDDIDEFEPRGENASDKSFAEVRGEARWENPKVTLDVAAGFSDMKYQVLIPPFAGLPEATFFNDGRESYLNADLGWEDFRLHASWTRLRTLAEPDRIYTPFTLHLDMIDGELRYTPAALFDHKLALGTGVSGSVSDTEDMDISMGRQQVIQKWIFLQDEFEPVTGLRITGGVRWDHHSKTGVQPSPRVAAVWEAAKDHFIRASAGYGYRNPSLRELWFDMPVLGGLARLLGNEDLEPERLRSYEASYRAQPDPSLRGAVTVYYNIVDDLISFGAVAPGTFAPENLLDEDAYGAEAEVEKQAASWLWTFANYSYTKRRDYDTHDRRPDAPRHTANAGLRATFEDPAITAALWVTFFDEVRFRDPRTGAILGDVDDYTLLSGRVSYGLPVKGLTAYVQAFNMLDDDHRQHPQGDKYGAIFLGGLEAAW